MFPNAPVKIIGNSDVKGLGAIGQDINAVGASVVGMRRSFPFGCAQPQDDSVGIMRDEDAKISEGRTSKL